MDPSVPLVVDNGTGVRKLILTYTLFVLPPVCSLSRSATLAPTSPSMVRIPPASVRRISYLTQSCARPVFPSVVGRPILRAEERVGAAIIKDIMVCDEAAENRNYLQVTQPMERGIVRNWEYMRHLWDYTFNEKLRIDTVARTVLLTEPPVNSKQNRPRMC